MHRSSFTPLVNLSAQEPLIVVEESHCTDCNDDGQQPATSTYIFDEADDGSKIVTNMKSITNSSSKNKSNSKSNNNNGDDLKDGGESPKNPYLLCPYPDMQQRRKHSLPSLQITEGMMASQVRRLSDAGGESGGLSPHDVEFLTTLTQKSNPTVTGRRHSVVTISARQSSPLFGRSRRESLTGASSSRRGSGIQGPPLTDHRGSIHNLQLDIMDGIVQTRKGGRSGIWTAPMLKENENNVPLQA